jgi:chromosome segregation ATPase
MKSLPTKIVLLFNIALGILCIVQWTRETRILTELESTAKQSHQRAENIVRLEDTVKKWEAEIARLDNRVQELVAIEKTNTFQIGSLTRDLRRTENIKLGLERQVSSYKEAVERQNENIKAQNESIAKQNDIIREQNDSIKKVVEERNDLVLKLNERTTSFNELVEKFNTFVAQVEQAKSGKKE